MIGPPGTSIAHAETIRPTATETPAQLNTPDGSVDEGIRTSTAPAGAPIAEFPRPQVTFPVPQSVHTNFLTVSVAGLASVQCAVMETIERTVTSGATRSAFVVEPAALDSSSPLSSLTATPDFIPTPPDPDAMEDEGNEDANSEAEGDHVVDDEATANDSIHVGAPGNYHDSNDADAKAYSDEEVMLLGY